MKDYKMNIAFILCLFVGLFFASCGDTATKTPAETEQSVDKTGIEYTSAYVCPMHCEGSGGEAPGKCPVCGMAYVKNPESATKVQEGHEGHNHDDHSGHSH